MNTIEFELKGIGKVLSSGNLKVPRNQREYSWEEEHVIDLCNDLYEASRKHKTSYFLGTVVLTTSKHNALEVVDGQQRLATIAIMLSVIRDIFLKRGEMQMVKNVEEEFLF